MLTTADWLLGSNSQSAAGLSTLSDRIKREYLLFFVYTFRMKALSADDLSDENLSPIYFKWLEWCERLCLSFRKVAVIVVVFCFKHGLTPDLSSLFMNGQIVLLFIPFYLFLKCFECSMLLPEYFFFWPECVLFHACTSPLFSYRCEEFPSSTIVSLPCTSIAGTCTTWQRIASSTMRDFTKHDFRTHIANLFYKKKKVTEGGKKIPSRFSKVKWIDFKDSRAVRRLRNYLYRSTPELYMQTRPKCIHHTLFQIGCTLNIPDILPGYFFKITLMSVINLAFFLLS